MSLPEKKGLLDKIIDKIDTRDILSVGTLAIIGWGVFTGYFESQVIAPILATVFGFWFGSKVANGQ